MRAWIYDRTILPLTGGWYREVLTRVPDSARLLDVGIGTAGALLHNVDLVQERDLRITGVDIDADYVQAAQKKVDEHGVSDRIEVLLESVYDHLGGPYDGVYFSASFMLMPDPLGALRHVGSLLTDRGRVYFTQTFDEKKSVIAERAKPLLKRLTTIDFGRVTYEEDFLDTVALGGFEVSELTTLGTRGSRTFRLAVAVPKGR